MWGVPLPAEVRLSLETKGNRGKIAKLHMPHVRGASAFLAIKQPHGDLRREGDDVAVYSRLRGTEGLVIGLCSQMPRMQDHLLRLISELPNEASWPSLTKMEERDL
jgi:hypothetical protein